MNVGSDIAAHLREDRDLPPGTLDDVMSHAVTELAKSFDHKHAGFGGAPKFPPSMVCEFLLRHAARTGDAQALGLVEATLEAMARGGIYDQLGGGFARYSVDARWDVPHFEKMLYDNALLLRVYTHWHRQTGSELAARVATETAEFMIRELGTDEGGFASALDADSDGEEGVFYVWTPGELDDVLGPEDGAFARELFGVGPAGNFERGTSTLRLDRDPATPDDADRLAEVRRRLLDVRAARTRPARDDKVVAAWNGLAVAALAEAGVVLGEPALRGRRARCGTAAGRGTPGRPPLAPGVPGRQRRCACWGARGLCLRSRRVARPCSRPPETLIGTTLRPDSSRPSGSTSPMGAAASTTRPTTPRHCSNGHRTPRTTPRRPARA